MKGPIQAGYRFGLVITQSQVGRSADGHVLWLCRCDCGGEKVWQSNVLKTSKFPSCGCYAREVHQAYATKHGGRNTREYSSWQAAIQRCENLSDKDYSRYGGRGIRMCEKWRNSFEAFRDDMGQRPPKTTLERENVNGNYEPGNCTWATSTAQSRNKRGSIWLDWDGERLHLAEVAQKIGITYGAAFMRLKRGKLYANHRV